MDEKQKKQMNGILLIITLTLVLMVSNILGRWEFSIFSIPILWSVFLYPLGFAIMGLIVKYYDKSKAVVITILACIIQLIVLFIFKAFDLNIFVSQSIVYFSLLGFAVSQILNISLIKEETEKDGQTIVRFASISFIDSVVFTLMSAMILGNWTLPVIITFTMFAGKFIVGLIYEYIFVNLDKPTTKIAKATK